MLLCSVRWALRLLVLPCSVPTASCLLTWPGDMTWTWTWTWLVHHNCIHVSAHKQEKRKWRTSNFHSVRVTGEEPVSYFPELKQVLQAGSVRLWKQSPTRGSFTQLKCRSSKTKIRREKWMLKDNCSLSHKI